LNSGLHDLHHLGTDKLSVGSFGVASGLYLSLGSLRESNAEQSHDETISGLGLNEGLNKGVPLLDHRASLISRDVHAVEVGVAVEALNLINLELELSPSLVLRLVVAVSEGGGENTTFKGVGGDLLTGGLVARSKSNASLVEAWCKNVVPLLSDEWMSAKRLG